jgi:hypothetical protein
MTHPNLGGPGLTSRGTPASKIMAQAPTPQNFNPAHPRRVPPPTGRVVVDLIPGRAAAHEVYGTEDPNGQALTRALDAQYGRDLNDSHAPKGRRFGMKGNPAVSFRGDLGPLQYFGPVAQGGGGRAGIRSGAASALPGSKGPIVAPQAVQALIGPGPL